MLRLNFDFMKQSFNPIIFKSFPKKKKKNETPKLINEMLKQREVSEAHGGRGNNETITQVIYYTHTHTHTHTQTHTRVRMLEKERQQGVG
jgi:hypothetical protein